MKKLMLILMAVPICAFAADQDEICRRNTLVMAVLQMNENGTVDEKTLNQDNNHKWKVHFNYDLFGDMYGNKKKYDIYGRTTCNGISIKSEPDGSSNDGGPADFGDANTFLKAAPEDVGLHCWCKMDGPVTSWWTYVKKYNTENECKTNCTSYCANGFANNTPMDNNRKLRDALFYAIW
jgi:hypothetical protein